MDYKEVFENQYREAKRLNPPFLFHLKCFLKKFDFNRHDLVLQLLDRKGDLLLDAGCGDGSLMVKISDRFNHLYGVDISST